MQRGRSAAIGALIAAMPVVSGCGSGEPARKDILVVVISGLRADHVSAYGYDRPTTPTMDAVAEAGVLYRNALTTTPWGLGAQASMLTGRYPSEHRVLFDHPMLDDSLETVAERMFDAGYETLAISAESAFGEANGFAQGFDTFINVQPEESGAPDDGAAQVESRFIEWLGERDGSKPFFAYLVLKNPRLPFGPPPEYRDKFQPTPAPAPLIDQLSQLWIPFARRFTMEIETLSPGETEALIALYDGEVAYADYRLGRVIDALEEAGRRERTVLLITSDSGDDLGDHGMLAEESSLFEGQVRVPLVLSVPGASEAGVERTEQVQTIDLIDALTALAAEPGPDGLPADPFPPRPVVVMEAHYDPSAIEYYGRLLPGEDLSVFERSLLGVRTVGFKYILTSRGTAALFDLGQDPTEQVSIFENNITLAQEMDSHLSRWASSLRPPPGVAAASEAGQEDDGETEPATPPAP